MAGSTINKIKINNTEYDLPGGSSIEIDDTTISNSKVWSSYKVNDAISSAINTAITSVLQTSF